MDTKELLGWIVLFLVCLPVLWLLWQFLKFAAKGMAMFNSPAVGRATKYTSAGLLVAGTAMVAAGASPVISWRTGGMHLAILGAGWLTAGIWLMATADRPVKKFLKRSAIVEFFIGTAIAAAGVAHALSQPQTPVLGTGTAADLLSVGGFTVLFAGLFAIAPGGTGRVPGGGDAGGGFGGGDGGGSGG